MNTFKFNRKGFSLIELILVIAIFAIILPVIYSVFFVGSNSYTVSKNIGFSQQDARLPIDYVNREIRNAKSVFLEKPTTEEFFTIENQFFELMLNNEGRLIVNKYFKDLDNVDNSDLISSQIISSPVESITFSLIMGVDEFGMAIIEDLNNLDVTVIAIEGNSTREYSTRIRFENTNAFGVIKKPIGTIEPTLDRIYYTKYE